MINSLFLFAFVFTGTLQVSQITCLKISSINFAGNTGVQKFNRKISKRSGLTYPPNSVLQMTLGVAIEGDIKTNVAGFAVALQYNADLPNGTKFFVSPRMPSLRRFALYDYLIDTFIKFGYNGLECLKKIICQIAKTPLKGDILKHIINYALIPSNFKNDDPKNWKEHFKIEKKKIKELLNSEAQGKKGSNCTLIYTSCAFDFFKYFGNKMS